MRIKNKKLSKSEAKEKIKEFFKKENLKKASPREVKKIKRLAAHKKMPLKEKRKLFCKKCLMPFENKEPKKVRIKNNKKIIECSHCGHLNKWKLKEGN